MRALTPKQAALCAAYLETGSASTAYRTAYDAAGMLPATIHRQAHALLQNSKVTARIAEAQAALREASLVSCESLTEALLGVAEEARGDREWSAAVAAYRTLASMHGLMIRKINVTTRGGEFRVIRHIPEGSPSHEPSSTPELGPTLDSMPLLGHP